MTVTAAFATEHFNELAAAAAEGSAVYITGADGKILELRPLDVDSLNELTLIDENGNRKFGVFAGQLPRSLGTGSDLVGPDFWKEWEEIERDWDETVIPSLKMNRDDEQDS